MPVVPVAFLAITGILRGVEDAVGGGLDGIVCVAGDGLCG